MEFNGRAISRLNAIAGHSGNEKNSWLAPIHIAEHFLGAALEGSFMAVQHLFHAGAVNRLDVDVGPVMKVIGGTAARTPGAGRRGQ